MFPELFIALLLASPVAARDQSIESSASTGDSDVCSYIKDMEGTADGSAAKQQVSALEKRLQLSCEKITWAVLAERESAVNSAWRESVPKRRVLVEKAVAILRKHAVDPKALEDTLENPSASAANADLSRLPGYSAGEPLNARSIAAWLPPEADGAKQVYAMWLVVQNSRLRSEKRGQDQPRKDPVTPERRKQIDDSLAANTARLKKMERIEDSGEFKRFIEGSAAGQDDARMGVDAPAPIHPGRHSGEDADNRPLKVPQSMRGAAGKSGMPTPSRAELAYVAPGTEKKTSAQLFWNGLWNTGAYVLDRESAAEKKRMAELRAQIDSTETGRNLVADLGGWETIEAEVDMRFAKVWDDRTGAYAGPTVKKGKKYVLVVNEKMLGAPDAFVVPVVAHELSHIRDFRQQKPFNHSLAIPSEYAAHRTQIQIFEEMRAKMSPAQIAELNANPKGSYQNFITLIWEDHLLRRYRSAEELAAATGNRDRFLEMSRAVMKDLKGGMQPGGPQLDHHLNGQGDGLYRVLTNEKDIVDLIREREASGAYSEEDRKQDQALLIQRNDMLSRSEKRDASFRAKRGFQLGTTR